MHIFVTLDAELPTLLNCKIILQQYRYWTINVLDKGNVSKPFFT